jgi:hypothetical protein
MYQNSGCGCGKGHGHGHDSHKCPPLHTCDVAKSKSTGCDVTANAPNDIEQNVILADLNLSIPVEAHIKLPTFARDIKEIRKNVHLTQCKVVPTAFDPTRVTLFVEGYVHKNIQYSEFCHGYLKDYSVNVPFKCYETIDLTNPANTPFPSSKNSTARELRQLAKNKMEADRCNFGSQTFEFYNNPIDCRLQFSFVDQWDILHNFDKWGRFNKITEKMNVTLSLLLTQKQQAILPDGAGPVAQSAAENYKKLTDC